jgi:HK97 gp10 family phage protein
VRQFGDVLSFATHLATLSREVHKHNERALDKALQVIQDDAEAQIGHYQDAIGHFPGWPALADSTEAEKERLGYPLDSPLLRTGELQESFSHRAEGNTGLVGSTDGTMVYHEFGTSKMPPRPVMGPAVIKSEEKVKQILGDALVEAIVEGRVIALLSQGEL